MATDGNRGVNGNSLLYWWGSIVKPWIQRIFQVKITGGASTITDSNLTVNRVLVSNGSGKVGSSGVTSTELGYLSGLTSNVNSQLSSIGTLLGRLSGDISGKQSNLSWNGESAGAYSNIISGSNVEFSGSSSGMVISSSCPAASGSSIGGGKADVVTGSAVDGLNYVVKINGQSGHSSYEKFGIPTASGSGAGVMSAAQANALSNAAPKSSPAFTGTPTAPTASSGTNSTQLATTAFVQQEIAAQISGSAKMRGSVTKGDSDSGSELRSHGNFKAGEYWLVSVNGIVGGHNCESGDWLYCISDLTHTSGSALPSGCSSSFSVVQKNVEWLTNAEIDELFADLQEIG